MAALQTLRNKAAVFITALIALALLAFILTDLLGSGNSIFVDRETLGVIDGHKVKAQEFQQKIENAEAIYKIENNSASIPEQRQNELRESVWQQEIAQVTFGELFKNAGVDVSDAEVLDMAIGDHIAAPCRQLFTNPQTGIFDREMAINYLKQGRHSDAHFAFYWSDLEQKLRFQRKFQKYGALIAQSAFCNKAQVELAQAKLSKNVDVNFVNVRYAIVPDSTVAVSESEIKARYKKDREIYRVKEGRDIEYVSFPIRPTDLDREDTRKAVEELKADFANPETNAFNYAQMNSEGDVDSRYYAASQLSGTLKSFVEGAQVGEVYGPYLEGETYKLSRLADVAMRPDSVKARHILVQESKELADSIYKLAKNGADFAALARQYSKDPGSAVNGGDLDWFKDGVMVPSFNEACFTGKAGDIVLVESQFGYHIINIQARGVEVKKYHVATIEKTVQYSSRTQQQVYAQAQTLASKIKDGQSFQAVIDTSNIIKRVARGIASSAQSVNSITHAREIVKWAYEAEVGDVSTLFPCDDEFVLATLTKIQPEGYADVNDVSISIAAQIRRDKKAEAVTAATQGMTLAQIADKYGLKVDSAKNVNYNANSVAGAGMEPALVGKAVVAEQGKVFSAIKGINGAYAIEVVAANDAPASEAESVKSSYQSRLRSLPYYLQQVVTDVEIEDNRIKFY